MPTSLGIAVAGGYIFFSGVGFLLLPGGGWVDPGEFIVMTAVGGVLWFGNLPI